MILKDLVRFIGFLAGNFFVSLCRGFYGIFFKLWSSCIGFSSSAIAWVLIWSSGLVGSSIHFILSFKIVLVTLKVSVEFT